MKIWLFAVLLLGLQAGTARGDEMYKACMGEAYEKFGWAECGRALEARSQVELDESWQKFMKESNPAAVAVISASRQAWEAYLESACEYYRKEPLDVLMNRDDLRNGYWTCRSQILQERKAYLDRITELYMINR